MFLAVPRGQLYLRREKEKTKKKQEQQQKTEIVRLFLWLINLCTSLLLTMFKDQIVVY